MNISYILSYTGLKRTSTDKRESIDNLPAMLIHGLPCNFAYLRSVPNYKATQ